ncbi:bifunctional 2-C-methyl-D-erythritol 4-phosphate cytidylyltransferase/2-C-methyl-D-erythritol 2,4-cyclodiphosphate synthase [Alphaproteobacteria bacterium HT1-32]|nr:bifunctional 2-C-methyl-D-erythritol 4-phosphate cytidylyltransferase/2-C-methyl-D-erythritol 2,4-cyclodiphosphate synthase [Alphaproteobacteria bacterium HT1-32]
MKTAALIVAGGRGSRFGGDLPKQYADLGGMPVIRHTIEIFLRHPAIDALLVVIHPDDLDLYNAAVAGLDLLPPVLGGSERQDSVRNGLEALAEAAPEAVLIHDAARPAVAPATIDGVLAALADAGGVIPVLPIVDTLKQRADDDRLGGTVDRNSLVRAQTPQGFRFGDILAAHRASAGKNLTDDAAVMEAAGHVVTGVPGTEQNVKITTNDDLARMAQQLDGQAEMQWEYRTGNGYDVHKFEAGSEVTICGIVIPHSAGLAGHSDADVGLHALTDALLGSIAEGDIGDHFPPSDSQWRGAPSDLFLRHAHSLLLQRGGVIANLDVTLICEAPKIGPHRQTMRERIGDILGLDTGRISVKATTTEKLGFTGRSEGIAAVATVSVRLPAVSR